uniref:SipW-dependent-type signal peptide-containing protein n=1 Tax=Pseudarthrobacter oxydans TaxID=1671 RepID=UPI003F499CAB
MMVEATTAERRNLHVRPKSTRWWSAVGAAVVLLLMFSLAPTPAHAMFSDTETASQKVSTGILPVPVSAAVTMTCQDLWIIVRPKVTVGSYTATASRANYYEIKLFDPSGDLETTGDISKATPAQPYSYTAGWQGRGTWKYEIRANYKVPGSTNTWASAPLTGTLTCS